MTLKVQDMDWQMRNNEKKRSRGESSRLWHTELFEKELRKWKTGKRDCILAFTNLTICKWKSKRRSCQCPYHVPNICIHLNLKHLYLGNQMYFLLSQLCNIRVNMKKMKNSQLIVSHKHVFLAVLFELLYNWHFIISWGHGN